MFRKENLYYWIIGFLSLLAVELYIINPFNERGMTIFSNTISVVSASVAFGTCLIAIWRYDARPLSAWRLITIGLGFYLLGEISWAVLEVFLKIEVPFPSIADAFWLIGYFPFFAGLLVAKRQLNIRLKSTEIWYIAIATIVLLTFSSIILLIPIILSQEIGLIEKILDVIYPLFDIGLLIPALSMVIILGRSLLSRPWRFICAGIVLLSMADFSFSYLSWSNLYNINVTQPGNFTDLIWMAGYFVIGIGALQFINQK